MKKWIYSEMVRINMLQTFQITLNLVMKSKSSVKLNLKLFCIATMQILIKFEEVCIFIIIFTILRFQMWKIQNEEKQSFKILISNLMKNFAGKLKLSLIYYFREKWWRSKLYSIFRSQKYLCSCNSFFRNTAMTYGNILQNLWDCFGRWSGRLGNKFRKSINL